MNPLIEVFKLAQKKRWCTSFMCTTCGSHEFRDAVNSIESEQLLNCLKELTDSDVEDNKNALEVIFHDIKIFPTGLDITEKVKGYPLYDYFLYLHEKCVRGLY
jgi:hypothetical protein